MANNYKDGWIVATLAVMVPIIMMFIIIIPVYLGAVIGLYFIYDNAIWHIWSDYDRVIYIYQQLYEQYETHPTLTFWNFLMPKFGALAVGVLACVLLVWVFIRYIRSVFSYD